MTTVIIGLLALGALVVLPVGPGKPVGTLHPLKAFPHPLTNIDLNGSGISIERANYLSYLAVEWMTWQG